MLGHRAIRTCPIRPVLSAAGGRRTVTRELEQLPPPSPRKPNPTTAIPVTGRQPPSREGTKRLIFTTRGFVDPYSAGAVPWLHEWMDRPFDIDKAPFDCAGATNPNSTTIWAERASMTKTPTSHYLRFRKCSRDRGLDKIPRIEVSTFISF